jgi:hypothetical protein
MIYNPTFMKIKKLLTEPILKLINKYHTVDTMSIHQHIHDLQEKDKEKYRLIEFSFSYPYSDQVADVLTDLIQDFLIDETDEGYILTESGKNHKCLKECE